ncbi:hypothetical protein [Longimycelium tulufanense]|uniref:hypothetical protein n=1 Tax=Longimycelium tulufanense TaxID=907463 RepID=UPI0016684F6A|nr:hypothetical protein [Longimycelium tulufanense]
MGTERSNVEFAAHVERMREEIPAYRPTGRDSVWSRPSLRDSLRRGNPKRPMVLAGLIVLAATLVLFVVAVLLVAP